MLTFELQAGVKVVFAVVTPCRLYLLLSSSLPFVLPGFIPSPPEKLVLEENGEREKKAKQAKKKKCRQYCFIYQRL